MSNLGGHTNANYWINGSHSVIWPWLTATLLLSLLSFLLSPLSSTSSTSRPITACSCLVELADYFLLERLSDLYTNVPLFNPSAHLWWASIVMDGHHQVTSATLGWWWWTTQDDRLAIHFPSQFDLILTSFLVWLQISYSGQSKWNFIFFLIFSRKSVE